MSLHDALPIWGTPPTSALRRSYPATGPEGASARSRTCEEGLVASRKEAQSVYYRICDARAQRILTLLQYLFCPELGATLPVPSRLEPSNRSDDRRVGKECVRTVQSRWSP